MKIKKTIKSSFQQSPDLSRSEGGSVPKHTHEHLVEFHLYAPQAQHVSVAGSFNEWSPEKLSLQKDYKGTWRGSLPIMPGSHEYRFFVDGHWVDDIEAGELVPNPFGTMNSVIQVHHHQA